MENSIYNKNCILIVDDDFINRELLKNIFSSQFTFEESDNGKGGLEKIEQYKDKLCAIILDVEMPEMSGIEVLEKISNCGITEAIPTFLITAHDNDDLVDFAYRYGVMDVVSKPVSAVVVERRIKSVIELFSAREQLSEKIKGQEIRLSQQTREMEEIHIGTLEALATAIEFRDVDSGQHVSRIYGMTKYILRSTSFGDGLSEEDIENIARGSIMHDVGKIAISDVILNKPARLTKEEFDIMKLHTVKGAELLEQISKIQTHTSYVWAGDIAKHHHERWDGTGYPDGLAGEEISVAAQVVSIVDVYDALVSTRVYKAAYTPDEAVDMIKSGQCGVFNPKLVECFLEAEPVIRKWYTDDEDEVLKGLTENTKGDSTAYSAALGGADRDSVNAVLDVMLLMTAIQSAYDMVICANLTKNTYHMIDYDRFLTHCADSDGVFDDLIEFGSKSIPASHRREFQDTFCRKNLLNAYNSGKKSIKLEHPQYSDEGKLHWVLTKVLFVKDNRTGDVLEITLSQYIDEEYEKREQTRRILTDAQNIKEDLLLELKQDIKKRLSDIIRMTEEIDSNKNNGEKAAVCLGKIQEHSQYLLDTINKS